MKGTRTWALIAFAGCLAGAASANNLTITNLSLENVGGGTADVEFDLAWSNSWRASWTDDGGSTYVTNWDAAWVFVKYRAAGGPWHHAYLADAGHTATGGTTIDVGGNGGVTNVGALVYRTAEDSGALACLSMRLRWNMAANGIGGTNLVDISVHAVEMVYVPGGAFYVGSGGGENYPFYTYPSAGSAYNVTSEAAIVVGTTAGNFWYDDRGDQNGPIPAAFPKGYAPFYCMKYEITHGQYTDFLNHLEPGLAAALFPNACGSWGHTIAYDGTNYTCTTPDRACNYLGWVDVASCLAWSGLRPMTELEFEKACRGPLTPVPNEYVWGDTSLVGLTDVSGTDGSGTETPLPASANCHYLSTGERPVRAGIFAQASSDRHASGAGYYGVMELAGNVSERCVVVGNGTGRGYAGTHGYGNIYSFPATWPDAGGGGNGSRGGFVNDPIERLRTSDRGRITYVFLDRTYYVGGRGVRTAP